MALFSLLISPWTLLILSSAFFIWLIKTLIRYYNFVATYPKGPTPMPFIGNLRQMVTTTRYATVEKFAKDFNGLFTLFIPIPIVVLSTYETLKEAFVTKGDDFAGRPESEMMDKLQLIPRGGVINSNGDIWREQRRTALSILRDFGMGKNLMEQNIASSLRDLIDHLETIENKENIDLRPHIQVMVANVINEVLFGGRFPYGEDSTLNQFVVNTIKMIKEMSETKSIIFVFVFPWLRHVPYLGYHLIGRHQENIIKLNQYVVDQVESAVERCERRKNEDEADEAGCFVEEYVRRMKSNKALTKDQLIATCSDFFVAGAETTTTTLRWSLLYLAVNQDIQDRLRDEILRVCGRDELPRMAMKPQMPYAQAVVQEALRFANIIAANLMHVTTRDTEVAGQKIPKGTMVNGDIHYILAHDPLFAEADKFKPERYLTEDGLGLNKEMVDHTVPFSIGKRACAGEGLARVELFLSLTAMIQNYRVYPCKNQPVDLTPIAMLVSLPKDQPLRLEKV